MQTILTLYNYAFRRQETLKSETIGWISITIAILALSTYASFGKSLSVGFSPISLLFISEILGAGFVTLLFGLITVTKGLKALNSRSRSIVIFYGVCNGLIAPFLWFWGLQYTSAISSDLFSRTEMLFLLVLSVVFLGEKIKREQVAYLLFILVGIACVALEGFYNSIAFEMGDIAILGSALIYALGEITIKFSKSPIPPEIMVFSRGVVVLAMFAITLPFMGSEIVTELRTLPSSLWLVLLAYGFITKCVGIYSFLNAIERLPVSTISMLSTLTIVGSMTFATLWLGETLHTYQLVGALLIIYGVIMMNRAGRSHHLVRHHAHSMVKRTR